MIRLLRPWWPVPALLALVLAVQAAWSSGYDPEGHAADHFASAGSAFFATFLAGILVWGVTGRTRRRPELWVLAGLLVAAALLETVGNVRVVDAIAGEDWSDAEAGALGAARPGFVVGHEVAGLGGWGLKGASVLLGGWLWRRREIAGGAAVAAVALGVLTPPWLGAGLGAAVAVAAVLVRRAMRLAGRYPGRAPGPAGPRYGRSVQRSATR